MNSYVQDAILSTIDGLKDDEIFEIDKDEFVSSVAESLMNALEDPERLADFLDQIFKEQIGAHRNEILQLLQENGINLKE